MFANFRRAFGAVNVRETEKEILVEGIPADVMQRDFQRIFRTSRIASHMFNTFGRSSFSFYKFFALDIVFMLDTLLASNRNVSKRVIQNIRDELYRKTWLKDTLPNPDLPPVLDRKQFQKFKKTPLPHQLEYFDEYEKSVGQYGLRGHLAAIAAGGGKAQPLDAKILTPSGWSTMGEMEVGKEVIAPDGSVTKVTGVHPQGKKRTFRIGFADGRVTYASGDHLWRIYYSGFGRGGDGSPWRIIDTHELFRILNTTNKYIYVQLIKPHESEDTVLPIDPYTLGVILGDGSIAHRSVGITKWDDEVYERISKTLPEEVKIKQSKSSPVTRHIVLNDNLHKRTPNPIKEYLTEIGLMGTRSWLKFIPDAYLHASADQRRALLQGLMDTDGTVSQNGSSSFCSTSYRLATGVQYLVRSLGGIASISVKEKYYTYHGEKKKGRIAYQVNIRHPKPSELFSLTRKKVRVNDDNQYAEGLKLRVTEVTIDKMQEVQCITVEHPDHLYITDDFIVTHNSITSLMVAEARHSEYIIILFPKNATNDPWRKTIENEYKKPERYWMLSDGKPYKGERFLMVHYEAMDKLLAQLKAKPLNSGKVTVILDESHNLNEIKSLRTQLYLDIVNTTNAFNVFPMSGTPVKAMGAELVPLLKAVDPLFTPEVEERFKKIFGRDGSRGLAILRNRLGIISYTVEKKDLGLDKPIMHSMPIKMPTGKNFTLSAIRKDMEAFIQERVEYYKKRRPEDEKFWAECMAIHEATLKSKPQKQEYAKYRETVKLVQRNPDTRFMGEEIAYTNVYERKYIEPTLPREKIKTFRDVKSVIKYTSLKIQGECLGRVLGRKRIECHVDMVKYIDFNQVVESTTKKTLVFTSFVEALVAGAEQCKALGLKPLTVYGKTNHELRSITQVFAKDPKANPLLATYASLSTAVPLTMADTMIMINSPFRAYIEEQAISRIYRIGADTQTNIYRCVLDTGEEPNISTRSTEILEWSQQMVEEITGVKSPFAVGASLEEMQVDTEEYDDNLMFTRLLNHHFDKFDIQLDIDSNEHSAPGYMRW